MERPEIPENIEALSPSELRDAFEAMREFGAAQLTADEPDVEFLSAFADVTEALAARVEKEKETLAAKERAAAALSAVEVEEAPAETEEVEEEDTDDDAEDAAEGDDAEAADAEDAEEAETPADATDETPEVDAEAVDGSGDDTEDGDTDLAENGDETEETVVDTPNAADLAGATGADEIETQEATALAVARVVPGVPGFEANSEVSTKADVAKALAAKWNTVGDATSGERYPVISIKADYPDIADLTKSTDFSPLYDDAIVAACAPLQPYYGVGFFSSEARPVFGSLPKFLAPRGGVTIYPSPRFSDATLIGEDIGMGQWTYTDDNNSSAEKNDPYDFECDSPVEYRVWGVYKSMLIRYLDAITFPELVGAHQNQLGSRFARYGEKLLLNAMVAETDATVHASATYGAARTMFSRLDQIGSRYRENERLEDTPILDIWLPRWVKNALRQDIIRAANDSGIPEVVTDGVIASMFGDIGMVPHFTYDNPTAVGDLAVQGDGHVLANPSEAWYILSVRGNLAILDLGSLDIGVNPNGTYRDSTLNKRNRFQMFMESFEGIVNRGAPVWDGSVEVLASGAQPTGATLITDSLDI